MLPKRNEHRNESGGSKPPPYHEKTKTSRRGGVFALSLCHPERSRNPSGARIKGRVRPLGSRMVVLPLFAPPRCRFAPSPAAQVRFRFAPLRMTPMVSVGNGVAVCSRNTIVGTVRPLLQSNRTVQKRTITAKNESKSPSPKSITPQGKFPAQFSREKS